MKKLLILLSIFTIQLQAAQARALIRNDAEFAAARAAAEVKEHHKFLQAAKFNYSTNHAKLQEVKLVNELLSNCLLHQDAKKFILKDLVLDYLQSDFCIESVWDINKVPTFNSLLDGEFVNFGQYLLTVSTINNRFEILQKFKAHENEIRRSIVFLKDGRLVTCCKNGIIKIWVKSKSDWYLQYQLIGHSDDIGYLIQLTDGSLASASDDKTIRIWKEFKNNQWQCCQVLRSQSSYTHGLIQIGNNLISASLDHTICLWQKNVENLWECKCKIENAHNSKFGNVFCLLSPDTFASCSNNNKLLIWQIEGETLKLIQEINDASEVFSGLHKDLLISFNLTRSKVNLYQKINGNWEYYTSLTGHVQKDGKGTRIVDFHVLNDGNIVFISSESIQEKLKSFYFIICKKNEAGVWVKTITYLGDFQNLYFQVLKNNKIIFVVDSNIFVLTSSDNLIDFKNQMIFKKEDARQNTVKLAGSEKGCVIM